jgi:hypothetical protein
MSPHDLTPASTGQPSAAAHVKRLGVAKVPFLLSQRHPMPKPQTERLGVSALEYFFAAQGWLFREQTTQDYGIDAHIEIVEKERPTGKLIALQIKAGTSFFKEETADAYVFRTDEKHIAYWVGHSMPVAVVLFNPETDKPSGKACRRNPFKRPAADGKSWFPRSTCLKTHSAHLTRSLRLRSLNRISGD